MRVQADREAERRGGREKAETRKKEAGTEDFSDENKHAHGAPRLSSCAVMGAAQYKGAAHAREEHMVETVECTS
jgi:hypothetical protein